VQAYIEKCKRTFKVQAYTEKCKRTFESAVPHLSGESRCIVGTISRASQKNLVVSGGKKHDGIVKLIQVTAQLKASPRTSQAVWYKQELGGIGNDIYVVNQG
jgi:hypothetical protein